MAFVVLMEDEAGFSASPSPPKILVVFIFLVMFAYGVNGQNMENDGWEIYDSKYILFDVQLDCYPIYSTEAEAKQYCEFLDGCNAMRWLPEERGAKNACFGTVHDINNPVFGSSTNSLWNTGIFNGGQVCTEVCPVTHPTPNKAFDGICISRDQPTETYCYLCDANAPYPNWDIEPCYPQDLCATRDCGHGQCGIAGSSTYCVCDVGYVGSNCDTPDPIDGSASTHCSQQTIEAAQKWEALVESLSDSFGHLDGPDRRNLKSVNDVFEVLLDTMHSGELLNVKY